MFWGFEVYFNLLVLLVVDCNKLTKMKKKMMEFYFQTKVPQKVLTHTHKINDKLHQNYVFNIFFKRLLKISFNNLLMREFLNFSFHFTDQHVKLQYLYLH